MCTMMTKLVQSAIKLGNLKRALCLSSSSSLNTLSHELRTSPN